MPESPEDLPVDRTQMDFSHTDPMFVLPYGIQAEIDCDSQQFTILESAEVETKSCERGYGSTGMIR